MIKHETFTRDGDLITIEYLPDAPEPDHRAAVKILASLIIRKMEAGGIGRAEHV